MSQNIEIEFKALLTKEQFNKIKSDFPFPIHAIQQENHYFETKQFTFKNNKSALRIRKKANEYTLTLKQQQDGYVLETHDTLNQNEFQSWIDGRPIFKQNTKKIFQSLHVNEENLIYYGYLTTNRWQYNENNVIYCLDESFYNDIVDYELEIEEQSPNKAQDVFNKFVKTYQLDGALAIPKIQRFFNSL